MSLNLEEELGKVSLRHVSPSTSPTMENDSDPPIDNHAEVLKNAVLNHRNKIERGETVVENIDEKLMESKVGQGYMIFASNHSPSLDYSNKNQQIKRGLKTESLDLSENNFISSDYSPRNYDKSSHANDLIFPQDNDRQPPINETSFDYNDYNVIITKANKTTIFTSDPDDNSSNIQITANEVNVNKQSEDIMFTGKKPKSMFFTPSSVCPLNNKDTNRQINVQTTEKNPVMSEKTGTQSIVTSTNVAYFSNSDNATKPQTNELRESAPKRSNGIEQSLNNDEINARLKAGNLRLKEMKKDQNKKGTLYFSSDK